MRVLRTLAAGGLASLLLAAAAPVLAAAYDFPLAMPPGCSGSNGSYTCNSNTLLGNSDTISISGTKPATITFSGDISINGAKINQAGAASDLTIVSGGVLDPGYQGVLNANVRAREIRDSSGQASFGGALRATDAAISLGYRTTVAGDIRADSDAVTLGDEVVASGHVTAKTSVTTSYRTRVSGDISAGGDVIIGQETTVGGAISVLGSHGISIGYAAQVTGNITLDSGTIDIAQAAAARACVQVTDGNGPIKLGYQAQVSAVCCGAAGNCGSNSCVQNNSTYAKPAACSAPAGTLVAQYRFEDGGYAGTVGELKDSAGATGGPYNGRGQGSTLASASSASPARAGSTGTCGYADIGGSQNDLAPFAIDGLPVSNAIGGKTSVAFWMYWNGAADDRVISFATYNLRFSGTARFGFNTENGDIYGMSASGLANGWRHVVAVFTNGSVTGNKLYIDGVEQSLAMLTGSTLNANAVVSSSLKIGGSTGASFRFRGRLDEVKVYSGAASASQVADLYAQTHACPVASLHHLEIQHASGTGLTCTPSTLTVRGCLNTDCSQLFTGGVAGTLGAIGGSISWPATAAFSIAAGSSSTTVSLQATTTTATVLGVTSSSPTAGSAATCNFGSPVCTFTAADAGFVFDVPHHVSESAQTVSVSAVRKSDSSTACTPAFASTSKAVTFSCGYTNPGTGTVPVRVGGAALNSGNNAAAACDSTGRAVTLAFNASGVASTTVQYADVGQLLLSARYAGAANTSEAGLEMTGSDSFITAPDSFTVTGITSGPIRAGSTFAANVSARNRMGITTRNFGRETPPQGVTLAWVRIQPDGDGAVNGSFSGNLGSFSSGRAVASDLAWTEVGRGDLLARTAGSAGYLNTNLRAFGSSAAGGTQFCANEGGNCVLPVGATATVYYGDNTSYSARTGRTGIVACNNASFGAPIEGLSKGCWYALTSATNGSAGNFVPHHFTVSASNACGSFSYSGQPIATTVTAQNAAGNTTVNFNGTATTMPAFAQAVTLADATGLGVGTLSGQTIAASAFSAGVASATPSYAFTSKTTAPQSLVLRATNGASGSSLVSSQGYAEPTLPLRSGRLRLSNAFGKATSPLQVPVATDYWSGSAWLPNSADSCTALAGASVALSNPRGASGAASTATSSAGAVAISNGTGTLNLAAPSPAGSTLSLDLAINLGSTGTDQSCNSLRPASTGAALPWLRAQNGSCAGTADRDPAARASFGIFAPETRKTVHVRDLY